MLKKRNKKKRKNPNYPNIVNKFYDSQNQEVLGATGLNINIKRNGLRVLMLPSIFLKLVPYSSKSTTFLEEKIKNEYPIASPYLFLRIPATKWNKGIFQTASVEAHEGRTRMRAIQKLYGDIPIEVHLILRSDDKWFEGVEIIEESNLTFDEFIKWLNTGVISETGNKILTGQWFELL